MPTKDELTAENEELKSRLMLHQGVVDQLKDETEADELTIEAQKERIGLLGSQLRELSEELDSRPRKFTSPYHAFLDIHNDEPHPSELLDDLFVYAFDPSKQKLLRKNCATKTIHVPLELHVAMRECHGRLKKLRLMDFAPSEEMLAESAKAHRLTRVHDEDESD